MKMKKIMKKILLILVAIFSVGVLAAAADNDKLINKSQLPIAAQQFIDANFAGVDIMYAKEECNILFNSYEVRLANGAKLEFSTKAIGRRSTASRTKSLHQSSHNPSRIM